MSQSYQSLGCLTHTHGKYGEFVCNICRPSQEHASAPVPVQDLQVKLQNLTLSPTLDKQTQRHQELCVVREIPFYYN